jgi:CRP-like cAMP-binding protein
MPIITSKVGETVIQEGDQGTCLYVVVDGQLRVHAGERSVAFLAPGDEVGEMALLDAEPRSASVTAVTTSRLLQLDQEPFYELLAANPQVTQALLRTLSQRLRERSRDLSPHAQPDTPQTDLSPGSSRIGFRHHLAIQEELPVLNKLFILKGMDTFSRISNDLLAQVALLLQEVDLAGGETLFRQGDPGHSLYIVAEGQLRIHSAQRTLAYANAGEVIGEMALLEGDPRSASVTAIRPTLLLRLDQQPFFELLAAQPDLGHGMIKMLSHRLRLVLQDLAVQQDK